MWFAFLFSLTLQAQPILSFDDVKSLVEKNNDQYKVEKLKQQAFELEDFSVLRSFIPQISAYKEFNIGAANKLYDKNKERLKLIRDYHVLKAEYLAMIN